MVLLSVIGQGWGSKNKMIANRDNKLNKLMNKKAGPIDITVLVFIALALSIGTLLIFYLHGGYVSSKIQDSRFLDGAYIKENLMNSYIDRIMDKSVVNVDKNNPIPGFINNFQNELFKYKTNGTYVLAELFQLESQIKEENVQFIDGRIVFSVTINIISEYGDKFDVNYVYSRKFFKVI
ncbi:hypothetical protein J4218_04340 [Candidatus Pacearchaeota archaeon]|nr:hypothetical protein [Candidatus Pacearchaeota archaeon]